MNKRNIYNGRIVPHNNQLHGKRKLTLTLRETFDEDQVMSNGDLSAIDRSFALLRITFSLLRVLFYFFPLRIMG